MVVNAVVLYRLTFLLLRSLCDCQAVPLRGLAVHLLVNNKTSLSTQVKPRHEKNVLLCQCVQYWQETPQKTSDCCFDRLLNRDTWHTQVSFDYQRCVCRMLNKIIISWNKPLMDCMFILYVSYIQNKQNTESILINTRTSWRQNAYDLEK